jgi:phospholipid/cholesterol/gamma-HCH transport system substrate-binding protein
MYALGEIDDQMRAVIPRDSTAVIRRRFGVAGAAFVDIQRGTGAPMDWSYAVVEAVTERAPTESISALIDEARQKVFPILDDTGRATHSLALLMARLERGEGNVGRMLADDALMRDAEATIAAVHGGAQTLDRLLGRLEEAGGEAALLVRNLREGKSGVPSLLQQTGQILGDMRGITRDLGRVGTRAPDIARNVEQTTENLPALLLQTQATAEQLEKLLVQLRGHWFLGSSAVAPEPRRLNPAQARP